MRRALRHPGVLLGALLGLALALRLLAWHWREFYPLSGDEQEYLAQALTLLRDRTYTELRIMRPPLYGLFLAGSIYLFDSLVHHLRLVQAVISAATVVPVWLLTRELFPPVHYGRRPALLAALLAALSYTLAAYATELLAETVFLFGLTLLLWLLVRAGRAPPRWLSAAGAGVLLGLLCLTRSVALPLLPLGLLWLALAGWRHGPAQRGRLARVVGVPLLFAVCAAGVIAPWSVRNYVTYGTLIMIDTSGAENLWLDNDPAGREAVKAQLYALGDDMAARQQLASERGVAVLRAHPQHVAAKAWGELRAFFALEYADDMQARRAIWVPPGQVAARLLLGDAHWLLLLLAGAAGLWAAPRGRLLDARWLLLPWALYVLFTGLLFHVELRYRLPVYPVLLPYAALLLAHGGRGLPFTRAQATGALATLALLLALLLAHRPYPLLAWQLGAKHAHLARAELALQQGDIPAARVAALRALAFDRSSALARVALARTYRLQEQPARAAWLLRQAITALPAHPHAHLLLGDLLRTQGRAQAARAELAYETAALQDLQAWSWQRFLSAPPTRLDVGNGLDLGFVQGFHAAEANPATGASWRWTRDPARLRLALPNCPADTVPWLHIEAASGPPGLPRPPVPLDISINGQPASTLLADGQRQSVQVALPTAGPHVQVGLRSPTFTPRQYDPASPDGRTLGVMLFSAETRCGPNTP